MWMNNTHTKHELFLYFFLEVGHFFVFKTEMLQVGKKMNSSLIMISIWILDRESYYQKSEPDRQCKIISKVSNQE